MRTRAGAGIRLVVGCTMGVIVAAAAPASAQEAEEDETEYAVPAGTPAQWDSAEGERERGSAGERAAGGKAGSAEDAVSGHVDVDLAFHTQSAAGNRFSVMSWIFGARVEAGHFVGETRLPFVWNKVGGQKEVRVGNATLTGMYGAEVGELDVQAGVTVALPTSEGDTAVDLQVLEAGGWVRGLRDMWMWAARHASFVAPVRFRTVQEWLGVGMEIAMGVMVPVDDVFELDPRGVVQIRGWGGYVGAIVRAGMAVQSVALFNAGRSRQQVSMGPFVELQAEGGFGGMETVINVDPPLGFPGGNDIWGVRLYGGARF